MPFTFSHPAAILSVSNSSNRLSQTGLVIGSMVPDLEFFFKLRLDENIGHTPAGIILFDLPVALLMVILVHHVIKKPLILASPLWVKERMIGFLDQPKKGLLPTSFAMLLLSILIGIGTHLSLDGMTHFDGWLVSSLPFLEASFIGVPVYEFLQYSLSVIGLIWVGSELIGLKKVSVSTYPSKRSMIFWLLVLVVAALAILIRTVFYPVFISFWDGFMMAGGAVFYGVLLASLWDLVFCKALGSNSQSDEFIYTRGSDPSLERRSFLIKQDEFFGMISQSRMNVNEFIDESQVVVSHSFDVQIDQVDIPMDHVIQSTSQDFVMTPFGFPSDFYFERGFFLSSYQKIAEVYFHVLEQLKCSILTIVKVIGFLGIFFYSNLAMTQNTKLELSQREEYIQEATRLRAAGDYSAAIFQLDNILSVNKEDAQILLFKGDLCLQNRDFEQAVEVYSQLIPLEYEKTIALINLSYALFMNKKPGKALESAQTAWVQDQSQKGAIVNYFNAFLWNVKTKEAQLFLEDNESQVDHDQYLVMQARLHTTSGNYSEGLSYYDTLVQEYPDPAYIQEYAEVLIGKKQWEKSGELVHRYGDKISTSQKQLLEEKLATGDLQTVGLSAGYFSDVASNTRTEQSVFWQNQSNAALQVGVRLGASQVRAPENQVTKSNFVSASISRKWSPAWESAAEVVVQKVSPETGDSFTGVTGKVETKYQPHDRRMVGVTYSSDILNFTADLLGKDIRIQNLGYVTHIMFDGKTGFYSQGSYGMLNDENSRIQFFGSIYRLLRTEPTLKTGINFSALAYADSETDLYFAPEQFLSTEVFVDYSTPLPLISKLALKLQVAGGMQQIEKQSWDPTLRGQAEINYRVHGFDFGLHAQWSNVAATSGTGYKFHYFTLNVLRKF